MAPSLDVDMAVKIQKVKVINPRIASKQGVCVSTLLDVMRLFFLNRNGCEQL